MLVALLMSCSLFASNITAKERKSISTLLSKAGVEAAWDYVSVKTADFNGDGKRDFALIGVAKNRVYVAVIIGPLSKGSQVDVSDFAIDPGLQRAICGLPALLEVESLDFTPQDAGMDELEDFIPSKTTKGLRLSGGGCDPVHLYWSIKKKKALWWRH